MKVRANQVYKDTHYDMLIKIDSVRKQTYINDMNNRRLRIYDGEKMVSYGYVGERTLEPKVSLSFFEEQIKKGELVLC